MWVMHVCLPRCPFMAVLLKWMAQDTHYTQRCQLVILCWLVVVLLFLLVWVFHSLQLVWFNCFTCSTSPDWSLHLLFNLPTTTADWFKASVLCSSQAPANCNSWLKRGSCDFSCLASFLCLLQKITCYILAGMCVKIKCTLRNPVLFLGGGGVCKLLYYHFGWFSYSRDGASYSLE